MIAELRALATRALAECCDDCRGVLREQLVEEESMAEDLELRISLRDWRHGLGECPRCGLHVDKDSVVSTTPPAVTICTHKRCGATFRVVFE